MPLKLKSADQLIREDLKKNLPSLLSYVIIEFEYLLKGKIPRSGLIAIPILIEKLKITPDEMDNSFIRVIMLRAINGNKTQRSREQVILEITEKAADLAKKLDKIHQASKDISKSDTIKEDLEELKILLKEMCDKALFVEQEIYNATFQQPDWGYA